MCVAVADDLFGQGCQSDRVGSLGSNPVARFQPAADFHQVGIADANVRVQAAIDGQGLVLADELMRSELASGALVAPFDVQLSGYGYVIMSSPNRPLGAAAVALRGWLCDG